MSTITPSSHIASISGRLSRTDRIHTRANKTTGKTYGVALCNPNPQQHPTASQQRARLSFRDTWHAVDTLLAVPALRTYFNALWQAHTAACRHHRPLSQSAFAAIPLPDALMSLPSNLSPLLSNVSTPYPLTSTPYPLISNLSSLFPLLRSRRTPFSTVRTMLFHLLYP